MMNEIQEGIRKMGFDAEMAENLAEVVRITREAAIEECAKVVEGTAPISRGNFFAARRDQCVKAASAIRALVR